jgi:hypothetical protein
MLPDLEMGSGVAGRPGSDGRKDDGGWGGGAADPVAGTPLAKARGGVWAASIGRTVI